MAYNQTKSASLLDFAPAYVVFIVNEQQARVLIGLETASKSRAYTTKQKPEALLTGWRVQDWRT